MSSALGSTYVCVDVSVDGKRVVAGLWAKIDASWAARTCSDLLQHTLERNSPSSLPLPDDVDVQLLCVKAGPRDSSCRPAPDTGQRQNATAFMQESPLVVVEVVPTSRLYFDLRLPASHRQPLVNALAVISANMRSGHLHLPAERQIDNPNGKQVLYDDIIKYLRAQGVGWSRDRISVGETFVWTLTAALFPLNLKVWKALNDPHNRGGPAPDPDLRQFFGRKVIGKKKEECNLLNSVERLQRLFNNSSPWVGFNNWPILAPKLQNLSLLVGKYYKRLHGQTERQNTLHATPSPARTADNAANVATYEQQKPGIRTSRTLFSLERKLMNQGTYSRTFDEQQSEPVIELNDFTKDMKRGARCVSTATAHIKHAFTLSAPNSQP